MPELIVVSLILGILALCLGFWALFRVETRVRALQHALDAQRRAEKQTDGLVDALSNRLDLDEEELASLALQVRRIKDQLTTVNLRDTGDGAFQQAIRLAARGASRNDLVSACGLSEVEADLVLLLHQRQSQE